MLLLPDRTAVASRNRVLAFDAVPNVTTVQFASVKDEICNFHYQPFLDAAMIINRWDARYLKFTRIRLSPFEGSQLLIQKS